MPFVKATPPTTLPVNAQGIPTQLQLRRHWVMWLWEERHKKDGTSNWTKVPYTINGAKASSTNPKTWTTFENVIAAYQKGGWAGVGIVLTDKLHGIDLDDCRDPITGELSEFAQEVIREVEGYCEVSPSGTGVKILTFTDLSGSRIKKEFGLEIYTESRYFALTGCGINGHAALPAEIQKMGWLLDKVWGPGTAASSIGKSANSVTTFDQLKAPLVGWDADRIRNELAPYIDLEMHYEHWMDWCFGLHHQFGGSQEGFELWDELFCNSPKYGGREYGISKWNSVKNSVGQNKRIKTLASLIASVKEAKLEQRRKDREKFVSSVRADIATVTDANDLQETIAPKIAKADILSDVDRETLCANIQAKAKELGVKLPVAKVRDWLKPKIVISNSNAPNWAKDWVYVTDADKFFNLATKQEVTLQGFRAMFNRNMPFDLAGNREHADRFALEQWGLPVVHHKGYMPSAGAVFEMFGLQWANLYRPDSVPEIPSTYTPDDLNAISLIEKHLQIYVADPRERELLLSWLAHNVQYPGKKIRWSTYLHGVPGDGKTFFSQLVGVAMGAQNVRVVNGSTLESNFTDWAVGTALTVIEEMKQHGHNRFDIMNRIKPVITNSVIEVHPKGKASYTAPNNTNYIITSNYLDGAPVDDADRRYMFVSSALTASMAEKLSEQGYFRDLFQALQDHPGAIRKWLLEVKFHPDFDADGRAPHTTIKQTVVEMSKSELENAVEDLLEFGADGVTPEVVSSAHLSRALAVRGDASLSTSRLNHMLTRLGFRFVDRKKWKGVACRIWVRDGVGFNAEQAIKHLNAASEFDFLR
jgi:hypothetical protein